MVPAIGYAIREQNRPILDDPAINAAEITFERADDPLRVEKYVRDMDFEHVSVHALKLSVASPDAPGLNYLEALKAIAMENNAETISDHMGFTRDEHEGVEMGHFAPPPYTEAALEATSRNVDLIQNYFGDTRFYLENIAYLFQFEGTMTEAEFLKRVLKNTGCGWLLDVTNVYANSINFKYDAYEFIAEVMPIADSVQMHLAGGFWDEESQMYIDSHSHAIPEDVFKLYQHSLEVAGDKTNAVFIERDQEFPDEAGWRGEVRRVREIAEQVAAQRRILKV
jgi:uncharacterized protein (UPF0276 family)